MGSPRVGSNPTGVAVVLRRRRAPSSVGVGRAMAKVDSLGIEPRASRMLSGCDTTTPTALLMTLMLLHALSVFHRTHAACPTGARLAAGQRDRVVKVMD